MEMEWKLHFSYTFNFNYNYNDHICNTNVENIKIYENY